MIPTRIQRSRAKGAKQPPNTKYCGRPSGWGNPFVIHYVDSVRRWCIEFDGKYVTRRDTKREAQQEAVRLFGLWFDPSVAEKGSDLYKFRETYSWDGFTRAILLTTNAGLKRCEHLSCWCKLSDPCHVDVIITRLLERAS